MSRYYQLIVFLTVYCIKNNCDQTEPSSGYQLKCKNDACSESIGLVVATQNYLPNEKDKLKYNNEDKIDIFGTTLDGQFYFAKLNDRQGLVNKKLVREVKQFHKDDDLISTHLDYNWQPIIRLEENNEDSVLSSSTTTTTSSIEEEITSNVADDLSISDSDENINAIPLDNIPMSDSPIDKLQTSFQSGNNLEESTSNLNYQHDQVKTVDSSIAVKPGEITKSQPEEDHINIVPSLPSIPSDPPPMVKATTEVAGTTFALDAFDDDEVEVIKGVDEISSQSSTPTPSIDMKPPLLFGLSAINNGIQSSNIPSNSESSVHQQSLGELNILSSTIEMAKVSQNVEPIVTTDTQSKPSPQEEQELNSNSSFSVNPDDLIKKDDQSHGSEDVSNATSSESPYPVIDESALSTPSPLPSQQIDTDNSAFREAYLSSQSESSSDVSKEGTGFVNNPNSRSSETTTTPLETELSPDAIASAATTEQVTDSQNGFTSDLNKDDGLTYNDKDAVNTHASDESTIESQVQNQDQSSPSSSIDTLQDVKLNDNIGLVENNQGNLFQSEHQESKTNEINKDISSTDGQKYDTGSSEINNQPINDLPSTPSSIQQQQQQFPSSPPPVYHQQQPSLNQNQYNHPNYHHHQTVHQYQQQSQQQQQRPPIIGTNDDYKYNRQPDKPSDEMTHQMAADVEKQFPPFPSSSSSSSSYLSSPQEIVTTEIPLSSPSSIPPQSLDSESSLHLSSVNNHKDFDSNLALPMQSSLLSNSASPTDQQQSTFNGASESLTAAADTFTQETLTDSTPVTPTNYPDPMSSQITLLTTLLPEPMLDYLHHINFSPSIFVILLMITITWIVMFITSKIFSSHKEKMSLEDQLCRNHGENFNLKTERDYLFDELAAEKEKYSRLLKEHLEIKDKFENINHHVEHSKSEQSSLVTKMSTLAALTRKQKETIEQLEKDNENLKMESSEVNKEIKQMELDLDRLSKELSEKSDSLEAAQMKIAKFSNLNEQLTEELESLKKKEIQLESDLKRMVKCEETIEKLKIELEKAEQEINSMKLFIDKSNESPEYSLESLLDGIKLKAELSISQKQLKSIKEEKENLSIKLADMEKRLTKSEVNSSEAIKAKDEAERRLQILKTYFNEQEVKLQSELGTWKLKYEEILARNESVPGYIEDLKRSNESFKMQVETLEREIAKREEKHRVDCSKLERDKHELYMSKIRVVDDLKNLKSECEILRKKLTLKSQGYSDDDLKHQPGLDGSTSSSTSHNLDSLPPPPPPPTGYTLEDTLDSTSGSGPWSLGTIDPPPPFPVSWMNSGDSSTSGYSSLPPAPMPLQQQQQQQHQPTNHHYHHHPHPHYPPPHQMAPMRDTYSPSSQRSHDQRSVRSDISFSSTTNNSHHPYSNYGPPPPLAPQTVQGPFTNPIPSHWSVNTQQQQQQHQQQHQQQQNQYPQQSTHNESSTNYNDTRNYYTGGR